MAPFNAHFLIAEALWPQCPGPWQPFYGQFCFGCVAPDVDKISGWLTQKDTHFFDRTGDYDLMASHRTAAFIKHQAGFLSGPFSGLPPDAQAFVLGYLCHLCVDEVSKHLWRRDTWLRFRNIGPGVAFAALDEAARQATQNYAAVVGALEQATAPAVIPRIPLCDLQRMLQGTRAFARAGTVEGEYLALLDMVEQPAPAHRRKKQQQFRRQIEPARRQIHLFRLNTLVKAGLLRSRQRLADFLHGRIPQPSFPDIPA